MSGITHEALQSYRERISKCFELEGQDYRVIERDNDPVENYYPVSREQLVAVGKFTGMTAIFDVETLQEILVLGSVERLKRSYKEL